MAASRQRHETRTGLGTWLRRVGIPLLLALTLLASANGPFAAGLGAGHPAIAHAQSQGGTPNTFDPRKLASDAAALQAAHDASLHPPAAAAPATPPTPHPIHAIHLAAPLATVALSATQPTHLVTSDSRLTVDVPVGAVSTSDVAGAAGGKLQLTVRQLLPGSGSAAGGSGIISLGTYLVQVVDGNGRLVAQGLRSPATVTLTYGDHDSALDLGHVYAVVNAALPDGLNANPDATGAPLVGATAIGLGPYAAVPTTHDAAHHQLTLSALLSTPSTTMTFNTNAPIATFGKPDPFTVDLSGAALTGTIPLDVPAGPGGLTPPVQLSYSSAGVSEQHNPAGAAGWLGEGWNLAMGSISWSEKDSTANTFATGGACTWADTWQLSDPYGTGAELIPPTTNVATYYDDTPNGITASPITWHTASESYARIISFQAPFSLPGMAAVPPCFRVWLTNGLMEEFGCTPDSLEYYTTNGQGDRLATWNLDLITDPRGNQIHLTYQRDMESGPGGLSYPR
ncbi:MAG TPA: hypothetical protein VGR57_04545, partial [Ktedonobacterales bacterium]|nr:hypothetical protein [Ktedonobacterales bacterium]